MLDSRQLDDFNRQGFLVFDQLIGHQQLHILKNRAAQLIDRWADDSPQHTFTTRHNNRTGDDYFLDSAEKISCFFEEDAFDDRGVLVQDRALCINKIGHAMHALDDIFMAFSCASILGEIAVDLGHVKPQIRQSMYIFKQPRIGGEVRWHQDATFFFTKPHSVLTFWFAIEDATLNNGCLWVQPGGHHGPLREQFIREGRTTTMERLDDTPWPTTDEAMALPVLAGTLVVFHGHLPHYSAPNRSMQSRQAFTLHVTDADATYAAENWLQAKRLPLTQL